MTGSSSSDAEAHGRIVADLCRYIEAEVAADRTVRATSLAARAGWSVSHTHRVFRRVTGVTPRAFAIALREARVRGTLETSRSVTDAIFDAGYASASRFYARVDASLGMAPRAFREGAHDETIRFGVGECSLGAILVAATEVGVCAVSIGDDPEPLVHALEKRFSRATLVGGDAQFERLMARVVGMVDGGDGDPLPLDVRGTAFQIRVWEALTRVPKGATTTYAELAQAIGRPSSARAVANACGRNPVAVAIPCHRVVRTDGSLSGYRWGIERKASLLRREAAMTPADKDSL